MVGVVPMLAVHEAVKAKIVILACLAGNELSFMEN